MELGMATAKILPHYFALVDILRMSGCESTLGILTGVAGSL